MFEQAFEKSTPNKKYGVKSYLHHFYHDCSGVGLCEIEQQDFENTKEWKRNSWMACTITAILGFCLFSLGLVLVSYGGLKSPVNAKTKVGAALFSIGIIILVLCFTLACFEKIKQKQESLEKHHFQERCQMGMSMSRSNNLVSDYSSSTSSPNANLPSPSMVNCTDFPISLYEVSAVQPLLQDSINAKDASCLPLSASDHLPLSSDK